MARRKQVERLLAKAAQDEYVLEQLLEDEGAPLEVFGFPAQQAAEKLLKAALVAAGVAFPRTHRLAELIDLLRSTEIEVPQEFDELRHLTPFAVEFRYDAVFDPDSTPLDKPLVRDLVRRVRAWASQSTQERLADSPDDVDGT